MIDWTIVEWAMAIIVLLLIGGATWWVIALVPKHRLMRCPETGGIAFVDLDRASANKKRELEIAVRQCEFWPEHKDCSRGCIGRYKEGASGFHVDLHSLRRFERQ